MKKLEARDLKDLNLLKHDRIIRKWACKNNGLTDSDLELLIYLDCIDLFTIQDFKDGTFYYNWDKMRFYRLQSQEWLTKVHKGNGRLGDHNKYTVSSKGQRLIARIYRILIGKEKLPESARRSKIMRKETYIDKVYAQAINKFNKSNLDG